MTNNTDLKFSELCNKIFNEGVFTECRAVWEDGKHASTKHIFGHVTEYDLSKEFPLLTLRKTNYKNAIDEMLWIWQKKSNNINDLNSHIWDSWADENGSIGKAYGWQVGNKYQWVSTTINKILDINPYYIERYNIQVQKDVKNNKITHYVIPLGSNNYKVVDMLDDEPVNLFPLDMTDYILHELRYNPTSRRIIADMYSISDLHEMNLFPCCYSITLGVIGDKLNMVLNQRSQDVLVANNWNVVQYSVLLLMLAEVSGYKPGTLTHVIADAHIYDRHIDICKSILQNESYPPVKVKLNKEIKNFYDFTVDDFIVEDYQYNKLGTKLPVAV